MRAPYVISGSIMIAAAGLFFSLFLFPSDAARYAMYYDLGSLLAVGIILFVFGLIRLEARRGYVVSGSIMIAVGAVAWIALYLAKDWSGYLIFGDLGFCLAAGVILLAYGKMRKDYPPPS